ncbi:MAG: hypothetical protein FJ146_17650 [Deltaproteobacteria bacterium]|nr:hypothetical protein [Deltaproteobacteria bacterium]
MGARAKVYKAALMVKSYDFSRRVGLIKNYYDLERLGLTGHDFCGKFPSCFLPRLIRFCKENPRYHVVSSDGPGRLINRLVEGKCFYLIGNGDKDPALELNYLLDPEWPVLWEDGISSALAEIQDIKNGRK